MSLLVPNVRDHADAHEDLDQDELYYESRDKLKNSSTSKANFPSPLPWDFEPVRGFFRQTSEETNDMAFNYASEDFGILKPWDQIIDELASLNSTAPENVQYKLLFLARHGQGWHNIASQRYPKEEWFSKWRYLGTDGEVTWGPDAKLTDLGKAQAKENCQVWSSQLSKGAPLPSKFYVSPLSRSIDTLQLTWEGKPIPRPLVIEDLRETIGIHLCHQRLSKSQLEKNYPQLDFDSDFPGTDELAEKYSKTREALHEQFLRVDGVLQRLFDQDDGSVISITSHAGTIRSFITVIGHRKFTIPTGGMIPIVVKGTRKQSL
ncbi:phosphomutase [Scheffersomyces xylosifermentans]|uniref:phosphomutase n=1 Tax=Scheffersomyces xylosifermentans TaxID=1304137 RepID=UPI00315DF3B4